MGPMSSDSKEEQKKRWSMEVNKDGKRYSIRVEQVENGYITRITNESDGPEYEYDVKEYISKSNPLANSGVLKNAVEKEDATKIKEAVNSLKTLL